MKHHGDIAGNVFTSQLQGSGFASDLRLWVCSEFCMFSPCLFEVLWFLPTSQQHATWIGNSKLHIDVYMCE